MRGEVHAVYLQRQSTQLLDDTAEVRVGERKRWIVSLLSSANLEARRRVDWRSLGMARAKHSSSAPCNAGDTL